MSAPAHRPISCVRADERVHSRLRQGHQPRKPVSPVPFRRFCVPTLPISQHCLSTWLNRWSWLYLGRSASRWLYSSPTLIPSFAGHSFIGLNCAGMIYVTGVHVEIGYRPSQHTSVLSTANAALRLIVPYACPNFLSILCDCSQLTCF